MMCRLVFMAMIAVAAVGWSMTAAQAGPPVSIDVDGWAWSTVLNRTDTTWGTHAQAVNVPQGAPDDENGTSHEFGTLSYYYDSENLDKGLGNWSVRVRSGEIDGELPEEKKFGGWIEISFENFEPGDFWGHEIRIAPIQGGCCNFNNYINAVWVELPGREPGQPGEDAGPGLAEIVNNGTRIRWTGSGSALDEAPRFIIYWTRRELPEGADGQRILGLVESWLERLHQWDYPPNGNSPYATRAAHAIGMAELYHADATLLPTLKNGVWMQGGGIHGGGKISDYFDNAFLGKRPIGSIVTQHIAVSGNIASFQGLYTFELDTPAGRKKTGARYTFVYEKRGDEWKIVQHHSSANPEPDPDGGGEEETCLGDLNNSGAVDVQDLLILLRNWGPCP